MGTWDEKEKRMEEDPYKNAHCNHEGVECETILICSTGCSCKECQAAINEQGGYGDPGTETKKL